MKLRKLILTINVAVLLSACGTPQDEIISSSSSSSGGNSSLSSSSSSSSSSSTGVVAPLGLGYSKLSNGKGGFNYEPSEISNNSRPNYDRAKSISAFEDTLYKHLRSSGCAACHSSQGAGQAPLHSDGDVALAHDYALTRVNFADPENSRIVIRQKVERHGCAKSNDSNACSKAGAEMLAAVEAWAAEVDEMIPEAPRLVPAGEQISEGDVESWIAADKATLSAADKDYIVYTSLHEMHNDSSVTAADLEIFRTGLSKALNSVARWAPEIKNPIDVNGKGILYKFDTRWYWGYNKGVTKLLFGGSDDDIAFGSNKKDYQGNGVSSANQSQTYGYSKNVSKDDNLAKLIWQRVLHGNVEGAKQSGNLKPFIDGFRGKVSSNTAGSYIKAEDFEWVEAGQLVYTITRPDVYNAIMMIPMHADQLETELGLIRKAGNNGLDTWDLVSTWEAITIDSRLLFRGETESGGWYWKSWDIFTGQIEQGNISIYDVYDKYPDSIRFPWWANPIPKFVDTQQANATPPKNYSFIATLAQPYGSTPAGCDPQPNYSGIAQFKNCRHYTGTGGLQQAASEIIWDLPNGLQGYMLTGAFNQRRVDAFINIVRDPRIIRDATDEIGHFIDFEYTRSGGRKGNAADPRLNVGSSCIGCHVDGMNRLNNDSGDWARMEKANPGSSAWPGGKYGIDAWKNDGKTLDKVIELYPPSEVINGYNEEARSVFLGSMTEIKNGMMKGTDKNIYVEPVISVVEYVQGKYKYPQTTSN